jgi:hypothetical protein
LKVYYAHHQWKYGTKIEEYELDLIKKAFPEAEIINPNGAIDQVMTVEQIMNECFRYVLDSDVVVFSSVSGVVGKGVFDEVNVGKETGKSLYYIYANRLVRSVGDFEIIQNSETRRIYAIVRR